MYIQSKYHSGASSLAFSTSGGPIRLLTSSMTPSPVSPLEITNVIHGPLQRGYNYNSYNSLILHCNSYNSLILHCNSYNSLILHCNSYNSLILHCNSYNSLILHWSDFMICDK